MWKEVLKWSIILLYLYIQGFIWMMLSMTMYYVRHKIFNGKLWLESLKLSLWSWLGIWRVIEEYAELKEKSDNK